jgi:hypothetical protein
MKASLKKGGGFSDWLAGVSPLEQLSAPRTLYLGFREAKLKKS